MSETIFQIVFTERPRESELARLLLQQSAVQYGVVMGYAQYGGQAVRTDNGEPLLSPIRSHALDFLRMSCRDSEWAADGFSIWLRMRDDCRNADVDWSGRRQLNKYITFRAHNADPDPYRNTVAHSSVEVYDADDECLGDDEENKK